MATDLPYIRTPSRLIGAPPYGTDGAIMHGMFVPGDRKRLQGVVDLMLNDASEKALHFIVLSRYVMFAALYAARTYSKDPQDAQNGGVRERDLGFWILVLGGARGKPLSWRLAWMPVFLFVDSATALASGREMFGYPKDIARIERSGDLKKDAAVRLSVEHLKVSGAQETAEWDELVAVTRASGKHAMEAAADADLEQTISEILIEPEDLESFGLAPDAKTTLRAAFKLPRMGLPTVLLKQIPSADAANTAVHRSIVKVTPQADRVRSMRFLSGAYSVDIARSFSHDIQAALALAPANRARLPFCIDMDFTVPAGQTLWRAP